MNIINIVNLRKKLSETLSNVFYRDQTIIIQRKKKPIAVLISLEKFEKFIKNEEES